MALHLVMWFSKSDNKRSKVKAGAELRVKDADTKNFLKVTAWFKKNQKGFLSKQAPTFERGEIEIFLVCSTFFCFVGLLSSCTE